MYLSDIWKYNLFRTRITELEETWEISSAFKFYKMSCATSHTGSKLEPYSISPQISTLGNTGFRTFRISGSKNCSEHLCQFWFFQTSIHVDIPEWRKITGCPLEDWALGSGTAETLHWGSYLVTTTVWLHRKRSLTMNTNWNLKLIFSVFLFPK